MVTTMDPQPIEHDEVLAMLSDNCLHALQEFAERQGWYIIASDVEDVMA